MTTRFIRWIVVAVMLAGAVTLRAGTVVSQGSGNWDSGATWAGGVPDGNSDVYIQTGHTITNTGTSTISVNSLTITGVLTHAGHTTTDGSTAKHKLLLDVTTDLSVAPGGAINVNGNGYAGATSGTGFGPGGGKYVGGSYQGGGGAGHGGEGGNSLGGAGSGGAVYEALASPVDLGSGGAEGNPGWGGAGGGAVRLLVGGSLTIDGMISANGANGSSTGGRGGSGSGGSVWVACNTFGGGGAICADGGSAYNTSFGGGGAGGRISCVYTSVTFSGKMTAYGGIGYGSLYGAGGTIHQRAASQTYGSALIDNSNRVASATTLFTNTTVQLDSLTVTNMGQCKIGANAILDLTGGSLLMDTNAWLAFSQGGTLTVDPDTYHFERGSIWLTDTLPCSTLATTNLVFTNGATLVVDGAHTHTGNVTIANGAFLTHSDNSTTETFTTDLTVTGDLTIESGAVADAVGRGYDGGGQSANGYGPGGGSADYSTTYRGGGGGGHGGEGGNGMLFSSSLTGGKGTPYGSLTQPATIGSGGAGARDGTGGAGGGAVRLTAGGALRVDGTISVNGLAGTDRGAGGAGGTIYLAAGTLTGSGTISANGGNNGPSILGGAGGGGRIACVYTSNTFDGSMIAAGGDGKEDGAGGTIYLWPTAQTYGDLYVENSAISTPVTTLISSNVTDTTVGDVVIRNSGHLRLATNQMLRVFGDWTNAAMFSAQTDSTLEFAGPATATIYGSNAFYKLSCTNAVKTLRFEAGGHTVIQPYGTLTLEGDAGNYLVVTSTTASAWFLTLGLNANQSVSYVAASYSDASGGLQVVAPTGRNDDNNVKWNFSSGGLVTWDGDTDMDWNTGDNWDGGWAPTPLDSVLIPDVSGASGIFPVLAGNVMIVGLTHASGASLALAGNNLTVTGIADIDGAIMASGTETLTFLGDVDFTGSGSFTPASSIVVIGGNVAQSFTAAGETFNTVRVTNNAATVTFSHGLTCTDLSCEAPGAAVTFGAGSAVNVTNLSLIGASGNLIVLRSSSPTTAWNLNVSGLQYVRYVDTQDSDASETIVAIDWVDSLRNVNWDFSPWSVWNGAASADWTAAANWNGGSVPGADSNVFINGTGTFAPVVSSPVTVGRLRIGQTQSSSLELRAALTVSGDAIVFANGTLTHGDNATTVQYILNMTVESNLTLHAGGEIDVKGRGFDGGSSTGAGLGGGSYAGASYGGGGGAGYGGEGGDARNADGTLIGGGGVSYAAVLEPASLGSGGGGGHSGIGGNGGGAIRLDVGGVLRVDGAVNADGNDAVDGTSNRGGGGSGGSIWITAGELHGEGVITANGGSHVSDRGGGGAGGRIACVRGTDGFSGTITARGGLGWSSIGHGAAGSDSRAILVVFKRAPAGARRL